jgi:1-acyl-sn-glycerol-3-phosphate acyltransferase
MRFRRSLHLPRRGACVLAGNHDAAIEIVLLLAAARRPPLFLGTGDVPLDRSFRLLGALYGFIPFRRGSMDRRGLDRARAALRGGELLGVFPEGGIWQPGAKETRRGVAWLSDRERVPVVPMGFRGNVGALPQVFTLRRPRLSVHIGRPLAPPLPSAGRPRQRQRRFAVDLEQRIRELPGQNDRLPDLFIQNLHRHLRPLKPGRGPFRAGETLRAVRILRGYFRLRNPGFLAYRFGETKAAAIVQGLGRLQRSLEAVGAGTASAAGGASQRKVSLELLWDPQPEETS